MGRDSLGEFEQLVLLACLRLGPGTHTPAVVEELAARTGREPAHATVYVALRRLEEKGLVESELGEATPERGGRRKRLFRVLPEALPQLREARDALLSMWEGLEGHVG
jgi:DNA-binding PadR family transcriptional regulator